MKHFFFFFSLFLHQHHLTIKGGSPSPYSGNSVVWNSLFCCISYQHSLNNKITKCIISTKKKSQWIKANNSCQTYVSSRYVPNVFAARAVDQQHQGRGGMRSGLTTFHCVMIVPNSLQKVRKIVIVYSRYLLRFCPLRR